MKRRASKQPRWVAVATTSIPDPRVKGVLRGERPHVVVTQLLDDQGRQWERYGADAPVLVGMPPRDPNDKGV